MEFPSFSRWSQLGQLRSSFNMTRYIVKGFASGKHSGDAKDHFLESGRETIKTLNADGKGTEKTVSQIQWSQEKTRNSHLHSSVSQAGSQMVGSTLQTPFPSPHRTSSPQVTCTPSLITEQGQRARSASGARMAPAPDPGRLLVCQLSAYWLSGFFPPGPSVSHLPDGCSPVSIWSACQQHGKWKMTHGDPWKDRNRQGFKVDHPQIYWQLENLAPFNLFSSACQKRSIVLKQ